MERISNVLRTKTSKTMGRLTKKNKGTSKPKITTVIVDDMLKPTDFVPKPPPPRTPPQKKLYTPKPTPPRKEKEEGEQEEGSETKVVKKLDDGFVDHLAGANFKELSDPFRIESIKALLKASGRPGLFGHFCLETRNKITKLPMIKSRQVDGMLRCKTSQSITSKTIASRMVPLPSDSKWALNERKNLLVWMRTFSEQEEAVLREQLEELSSLSNADLVGKLKEEFKLSEEEIRQLPEYFPKHRKEEMVQYLLAYRVQQQLLFSRGFVLQISSNHKNLHWIATGDFVIDPEEHTKYGKDGFLVSGEELARVRLCPVEMKIEWVKKQLNILIFEDEYEGPLRCFVKRKTLLEKAANWINSLHGLQRWQTTRYEFKGERAFDSGGVAKEWFRLVAESLFQEQFGLFRRCVGSSGQISYDINPDSGLLQPERHLFYFRFAGRLLAKALIEGCFIDAYLHRAIYKLLLRKPVTFEDLRFGDQAMYNSLKSLIEETSDEDLAALDMNFVFTAETFGELKEVELKAGGADIVVTRENLLEYVGAVTKYLLFDRYKPQLEHLLLGFYDILPPQLFVVFDEQEFENMVCGVATIDIEDFRNNVIYLGQFKGVEEKHQTVEWFWDILNKKFTEEDKRNLLQFVTGSSRLPVGGFKALDDGKSLRISIEGISPETSVYPRSHTCFNRLELPVFDSSQELEDRLRESIKLINGFNLE